MQGLAMKMTTSVLWAGLVLLAGAVSGCVSWASYPAAPGETAVKSPNAPAIEELMMTGMKWAVTKHPAVDSNGQHIGGGRVAINLPPGVKPKVYRRVAEAAGGGAEPITEANKNLPTYHVKSLRIRGDEAQIIIVCPAATLGAAPGGGPVYQEIKLGIAGGLGPWRVVNFREWGPGMAELPPINYYVQEPDYVPDAPKKTDKPAKVPAGP